MKKILAAALAAILLATSLTGCGNAENESSSNQSSNQSSSDNNTSGDNTESETGIADHLEEAVEAYYNYIKNDPNAMAYPSMQSSVDGTVWGKTSDGYLYLIVHENGEQIAKVLEDPSVELDAPDPEVNNSGLNYPDNKAGELAKRVLNTEWAYMEVADEQEFVDLLFPGASIDLDLCEEYFLAGCGMSAVLQKVIIIKPKAGDMPA